MQPSAPPPRSTFLRRYGPMIAILAALALVAGVVFATRGGSPKASSNAAATGGKSRATKALSWTQAEAEGKTKSIDWGSRCDTSTGKLKIPYYFAGQCYAPFSGNNGGATYQGVTARSIKVVLYLPEANDPVLSYIEGAIADTDTNQQTIATVQGYAKFLQSYYETYGRKVDLIPFVATGSALDDVAARADATTIVQTIKPFAVIGGPALTAAFGQEIVANKIFCVDCIPSQPDSFYAQHSPYAIGLDVNADEAQIQLADYIGAQLKGLRRLCRRPGYAPRGPQIRACLHLDRTGFRDSDRSLCPESGEDRREASGPARLRFARHDRLGRADREAQGCRSNVRHLQRRSGCPWISHQGGDQSELLSRVDHLGIRADRYGNLRANL